MTEQDAIRQIKHGHVSGLELLVKRYQVRAVRTAYLITRDRALAEDVVQEAFLHFFDHVDQFDETRPFAPYFLRSVVNRAVRRVSRDRRTIDLDSANNQLPAPDLIENADTREAIWNALGQLSPEQRAAVVQFYFLDMTEREISQQADAPLGTVKWRLYKARNRLRELLSPLRPRRPTSTELTEDSYERRAKKTPAD
jgi:RNA polymerase sigma-70 factor (ECF subfamily)